MPNDKIPPWSAGNPAAFPTPRRALDPETGLPFRSLNAPQNLLLTAMKKFFDFFHNHFLLRRITAVVAGAVAAINAAHVAPEITPDQLAAVVAVMGAARCPARWCVIPPG
jgi:hypothetical protein